MFGKKITSVVTVDSLVNDLTAKVEALRELSTAKKLEVEAVNADIVALEKTKADAENESSRAVSIADKIAALLA